jgi:hypothetical protein
MGFNFSGGLAPEIYVGQTRLGLHVLPFFLDNTSNDWFVEVHFPNDDIRFVG